jgi:hypothetical protein
MSLERVHSIDPTDTYDYIICGYVEAHCIRSYTVPSFFMLPKHLPNSTLTHGTVAEHQDVS